MKRYSFEVHGAVDARFLEACQGDAAKAEEQWIAHCEWRKNEGIDSILDQPQPHFHDIKAHYPHFYHKTSLAGNLVYYERPGVATLRIPIKRKQISIAAVVRHYVFMNEYMYNVYDSRPDCKVVSIWDVTGAGPYDLVGNARKLMAAIMKCMKDNYPERTEMLFIINAPQWFTAMWAVIKTMADPSVLDKIKILGTDYTSELFKWVAPCNVPTEFGGEDPTPIGQSDEEIALRNVADQLNGGPGASYAVSLAARAAAEAKEPTDEVGKAFDMFSTLSWLEIPADKTDHGALTENQTPLQPPRPISEEQTTETTENTPISPPHFPLLVDASHNIETTFTGPLVENAPEPTHCLPTSPPSLPAPSLSLLILKHPEGSRPNSLPHSDSSRYEEEPAPENFVELVALWATTAASAFKEVVDPSIELQPIDIVSPSQPAQSALPALPAPPSCDADEAPWAPSLLGIIQPLIAFRDNLAGAAGALVNEPDVKDIPVLEPTAAPLAEGIQPKLPLDPPSESSGDKRLLETEIDVTSMESSDSTLKQSESSIPPPFSPSPQHTSPFLSPAIESTPTPSVCTREVEIGPEELAPELASEINAENARPCEAEGTRKKTRLKRIVSKSLSPLQWRNKKAPITEGNALRRPQRGPRKE